MLLAGPAANHFIFTNESLALTQTHALHALLGRSILTLSGDELKQVRSAVHGYLRPEMVRRYVGKMDHEVRRQIKLYWVCHNTVTVRTDRTLTCFLIYEFYISIHDIKFV